MTNRLDNMTKDERLEAGKPKRNYVIDQCCSVDDLRCCLSNMKPETLKAKIEAQNAITEAIMYEQGQRVTVVNMLNAKWRQIQKTI